MGQLAREKETMQERLVQITRERDTALRVSENRRRAWEMQRIQSLERENLYPIHHHLVAYFKDLFSPSLLLDMLLEPFLTTFWRHWNRRFRIFALIGRER